MKWTPGLRLALVAVVFVAWLGWLAYLVLATSRLDRATGGPRPLPMGEATLKVPRWVLSRPQFLVADLVVIADLQAASGKADPTVKNVEVYWTRSQQDKQAGPELVVYNLPECDNWT